MSKYYVQCGPIQTILTADSVEQAAMASLDRTLQSHLWIYDDPDLSRQDCRDHLMLEALLHLEPMIRVSDRGFDRADAQLVGAPETIDRWHRLMVGMNQLFIAAGIAPRSMAEIAAGTPEKAAFGLRRPR